MTGGAARVEPALPPRRGRAARALLSALGWPLRLVRGCVGLVANPMLIKELKVSSRRKRTYFLRAGYLLLLVLALLLTWWGVTQQSLTQSTAELLQRQGQTGQTLSFTLGWIQLIALILIAPMLTGSCVSDEIEDRSLDVLLITPLTAAQIIVGKMLSRLAYVGLLVLLSMPLLLAMRTYGGFTLEQLVRLELLSLTTALLGASVAILLSCWEARGWRAVAMSYFWLALWWFALPLIAVAFAFLVISTLKKFIPWLPMDAWMFDWEAYPFLMMHNNPVLGMFLLTFEAASGGALPFPTGFAFVSVNIINAGMSAVLVLLAVPLLRRTANKRLAAVEQRAANWLAGLFRTRRATPAVPVATAPSMDESGAPRDETVINESAAAGAADELEVPKVWDNAILWREMRFNLLRRPIATGAVCVIVLILLVWYNLQAHVRGEVGLLLPLIWLAVLAQLVIACVVSPTVIASEKQAGSWEVLLCVPMKPLTILWTKTVGALKLTMIPLAVLMLELLYYSSRHSMLVLLALQVALISVAFSILLACTGTVLSLLLKRSVTAMAANLALAIGAWAVLPAIVGILSELWSSQSDQAFGVVFVANPFYWLAVMSEYLDSVAWRGGLTYDLEFWDVELGAGEFTWLVTFVSAVVSAAGFGLLYISSTWFNPVTGRSS